MRKNLVMKIKQKPSGLPQWGGALVIKARGPEFKSSTPPKTARPSHVWGCNCSAGGGTLQTGGFWELPSLPVSPNKPQIQRDCFQSHDGDRCTSDALLWHLHAHACAHATHTTDTNTYHIKKKTPGPKSAGISSQIKKYKKLGIIRMRSESCPHSL